ncbi:hypothetical protein T484DRAFT_1880023, partial [Baffinella frigidus]
MWVEGVEGHVRKKMSEEIGDEWEARDPEGLFYLADPREGRDFFFRCLARVILRARDAATLLTSTETAERCGGDQVGLAGEGGGEQAAVGAIKEEEKSEITRTDAERFAEALKQAKALGLPDEGLPEGVTAADLYLMMAQVTSGVSVPEEAYIAEGLALEDEAGCSVPCGEGVWEEGWSAAGFTRVWCAMGGDPRWEFRAVRQGEGEGGGEGAGEGGSGGEGAGEGEGGDEQRGQAGAVRAEGHVKLPGQKDEASAGGGRVVGGGTRVESGRGAGKWPDAIAVVCEYPSGKRTGLAEGGRAGRSVVQGASAAAALAWSDGTDGWGVVARWAEASFANFVSESALWIQAPRGEKRGGGAAKTNRGGGGGGAVFAVAHALVNCQDHAAPSGWGATLLPRLPLLTPLRRGALLRREVAAISEAGPETSPEGSFAAGDSTAEGRGLGVGLGGEWGERGEGWAGGSGGGRLTVMVSLSGHLVELDGDASGPRAGGEVTQGGLVEAALAFMRRRSKEDRLVTCPTEAHSGGDRSHSQGGCPPAGRVVGVLVPREGGGARPVVEDWEGWGRAMRAAVEGGDAAGRED